MQHNIPVSDELKIPADLENNILFFPNGTGRQFVPVWWAKKNMPDGDFAFFFKDVYATTFMKEGLKVLYFYGEAGDIIELAKHAAWTISTDSFPSHLLQSAISNSTILITELLKSRVISPVYKGKVTDAVVECHPCLHLDRYNHPLCAAGYTECINWKSKEYTNNVKKDIENLKQTKQDLSPFNHKK